MFTHVTLRYLGERTNTVWLLWPLVTCCAILLGCAGGQDARTNDAPLAPTALASSPGPPSPAIPEATQVASTPLSVAPRETPAPAAVQARAPVERKSGITPITDPGLAPVRLSVPEKARQGVFAQDHELRVPPGFHISVFATGLSGPRGLAVSPQGDLYVTLINSGKVVALLDREHEGAASDVATYLEGLDHPHGIAFGAGWMYVGETGKVERARDTTGGLHADQRETVVPSLPNDGGHVTRTVHVGPDKKLYVSIGSSCNVCIEKNPLRATIVQYNLDGTGEHVFARGLRNAVGFTFSPLTGALWAVINGRDNLGDDLPGEDITDVHDGDNFGWPTCYGDRIPDLEFGKTGDCDATTEPALQIQAHSAPLGALFYAGAQLPASYRGDVFVPLHGSWNRTTPTGYKIITVAMREGQPVSVQDFATGWMLGTAAWGRPVDMVQGSDGALYVSDDQAGAVYRIWYQP
jgi:glucose/arabinose dehydrogenase